MPQWGLREMEVDEYGLISPKGQELPNLY